MASVVMLSVFYDACRIKPFMLSIVMPSDIMPSAVAPTELPLLAEN
jgi:hypothetical protein